MFQDSTQRIHDSLPLVLGGSSPDQCLWSTVQVTDCYGVLSDWDFDAQRQTNPTTWMIEWWKTPDNDAQRLSFEPLILGNLRNQVLWGILNSGAKIKYISVFGISHDHSRCFVLYFKLFFNDLYLVQIHSLKLTFCRGNKHKKWWLGRWYLRSFRGKRVNNWQPEQTFV